MYEYSCTEKMAQIFWRINAIAMVKCIKIYPNIWYKSCCTVIKSLGLGKTSSNYKLLTFGHFPYRGGGVGGPTRIQKFLVYFCSLIFGLYFGQYLGGGGWLNLFQKCWESF